MPYLASLLTCRCRALALLSMLVFTVGTMMPAAAREQAQDDESTRVALRADGSLELSALRTRGLSAQESALELRRFGNLGPLEVARLLLAAEYPPRETETALSRAYRISRQQAQAHVKEALASPPQISRNTRLPPGVAVTICVNRDGTLFQCPAGVPATGSRQVVDRPSAPQHQLADGTILQANPERTSLELQVRELSARVQELQQTAAQVEELQVLVRRLEQDGASQRRGDTPADPATRCFVQAGNAWRFEANGSVLEVGVNGIRIESAGGLSAEAAGDVNLSSIGNLSLNAANRLEASSVNNLRLESASSLNLAAASSLSAQSATVGIQSTLLSLFGDQVRLGGNQDLRGVAHAGSPLASSVGGSVAVGSPVVLIGSP